MKNKTIKEWFEDELPADIAEMAICNAEIYNCGTYVLDTQEATLKNALSSAFLWQETPQGHAFWQEVHDGNCGYAPKAIDCVKACDAMEAKGGSFAASLARTYRLADPDNRERITRTWADLFARYGKVAQ